MASRQPSAFGTLLRRQRKAARLTQQELAAHAGVGVNTISDLEAGVAWHPARTPLPC